MSDWHEQHQFYVVHDDDPQHEVACADTSAEGEYAMVYLLASGEEDVPLRLCGPGLTYPVRALRTVDEIVIVLWIEHRQRPDGSQWADVKWKEMPVARPV